MPQSSCNECYHLWRTEAAKTAPSQPELTCLYAAERVFAIQEQLLPRAGGLTKRERPILRQLEQSSERVVN